MPDGGVRRGGSKAGATMATMVTGGGEEEGRRRVRWTVGDASGCSRKKLGVGRVQELKTLECSVDRFF